MPPKPSRNIIPPSSSPAPVRESQPQINSPTATALGTQPHHALYDTPPPGMQPVELKHSECVRKLSARGRDVVVSTGKPLAGHATTQPSQPHPAPAEPPATQTNTQQTAKKLVKRPPLRFDDESSDGEPTPTRPGSTRHQAHPPPPKCARGDSSVARGDGTSKQSITIDADAAHSLSKLLGVDPKTMTASAINYTIKSLSDHHPPQVGSSQRYSQVS